jgi:integrase
MAEKRGWFCPFVVEYHGAQVGDIKKAFRRACDRAGIADVRPHTLRHTAGTLMAKEGVELFKISKMLGHSMAKTTELYAHHRPEWLREAADVLGKATGDSHKKLSHKERGPAA